MDQEKVEALFKQILEQIEPESHQRQGLQDTPKRVARAYAELFSGYGKDGKMLLDKCFEDDVLSTYDGAVIVRKVEFFSQCEHHMAVFHGHAWVGYIPGEPCFELTLADGTTVKSSHSSGDLWRLDRVGQPTLSVKAVRELPGKVVGLSKLAKLVELYARRLQVQERMTQQIADDMEKYLQPLGVMVLVKAVHTCMCARGARALGTDTVTCTVKGVFKDKPEARAEFMQIIALA